MSQKVLVPIQTRFEAGSEWGRKLGFGFGLKHRMRYSHCGGQQGRGSKGSAADQLIAQKEKSFFDISSLASISNGYTPRIGRHDRSDTTAVLEFVDHKILTVSVDRHRGQTRLGLSSRSEGDMLEHEAIPSFYHRDHTPQLYGYGGRTHFSIQGQY